MRTLATLFFLATTSFAFHPTARAVNPPPDGGYPNRNTAEGTDALFSLNIDLGLDNTALGYDALYLNTNGYGNTGVGSYALYSNNGIYNTGLGFDALIERDRDRRGRSVSVHGDVRIDLRQVDVQPVSDCFGDALIGLVRNEKIDLV